MAFYKHLFNYGYLEGDNKKSPISLKGAKKLAEIFEETYDFISIEIFNENEFFEEFETFNKISQKFTGMKKQSDSKIMKKDSYSYEEEDDFFNKLKQFNITYGKFKESEPKSQDDFPKECDLFFELIQFVKNKEEIIINLMCKKILRSEKKSTLNFYIWTEQQKKHYSTVVNIGKYYIFLDSCSLFFKRWPGKELVSIYDSNSNKLFDKDSTYVMFSFIQNDDFNCVSFAFAFIEIIIHLYEKYDENKLINYLSKYFCCSWKDNFLTELICYTLNYSEPLIYYLPEELLILSQFPDKLKYLLVHANNTKRYDEIQVINKILADKETGHKIEKYRNFHLDCLMESINELIAK